MKENELITNFYQEQKKYGYLESLNIYRNMEDDSLNYNIDMSLFNYPYVEGDDKLLITFYDVKNIKINSLDGLFRLVFLIKDISENQMEGIKYKVIEDENNLFSFYCRKIEFNK